MSGAPGPSRPTASTSAKLPTSASSSSSSSSGPFAANAARASPAAATSSVARGKQPVQNSGGGPVQQQGARVVQPGGASAQAGGAAAGAVSVGGPGGVVRRMVLNSILVNVRQVRAARATRVSPPPPVLETPQADPERGRPSRAEGQPDHRPHPHRPMGVRRHQVRLPGRRDGRRPLPLVRPLPPWLLDLPVCQRADPTTPLTGSATTSSTLSTSTGASPTSGRATACASSSSSATPTTTRPP